MKNTILLAVYVFFALLTYTAMNAQSEHDCKCPPTLGCDDEDRARNRTFAIFYAIFPPGWIAGALVTNFYHHGFKWTTTP